MPEPTPSGPLRRFPRRSPLAAPADAAHARRPPATLSSSHPPAGRPAKPGDRPPAWRAAARPAAAPKSRWLARTIATLTTLVLLAIVGLVAAWRFAPDRVPPALRPIELLRAIGIATPTTMVGPPPRQPAPPESRYEE